MAVRWLVTQVDFPLPGSPFVISDGTAVSTLEQGTVLRLAVESQPIRGVEIEVVEDFITDDLAGRLRSKLLHPTATFALGGVMFEDFYPPVGTGSRLLPKISCRWGNGDPNSS